MNLRGNSDKLALWIIGLYHWQNWIWRYKGNFTFSLFFWRINVKTEHIPEVERKEILDIRSGCSTGQNFIRLTDDLLYRHVAEHAEHLFLKVFIFWSLQFYPMCWRNLLYSVQNIKQPRDSTVPNNYFFPPK
jgi:hypothetical protein